MDWEQKKLWSQFVKSGRIDDYLQYRMVQRYRHSSDENPLQRMENSSKYKKFY